MKQETPEKFDRGGYLAWQDIFNIFIAVCKYWVFSRIKDFKGGPAIFIL